MKYAYNPQRCEIVKEPKDKIFAHARQRDKFIRTAVTLVVALTNHYPSFNHALSPNNGSTSGEGSVPRVIITSGLGYCPNPLQRSKFVGSGMAASGGESWLPAVEPLLPRRQNFVHAALALPRSPISTEANTIPTFRRGPRGTTLSP